MQVFRRQTYNQLWFTLRSDEVLGQLDSSYIQDYFGVQGQVSLYNIETQVRVPVLINEVVGEDDPTPFVSHDVFSGYIDLSGLQDGNYKVQGLVRDVVGNYTILSAIENPSDIEKVIQFDLRLTDQEVTVIFPNSEIKLGILFSVEMPTRVFEIVSPIMKNSEFLANINNVSVFSAPIVEYLGTELTFSKGVSLQSPIIKNLEFIADMGFNG